jgi:hypothetical protein
LRFLAVALALGAATSSGSATELEELKFLTGSWKGESGKASIEERWTDAAGGMMLGVSRTIVSGKTVAFEFLRIEVRPDGIFYVAQPNGRPPTDFKMTRSSSEEAVFENSQHDHPKVIRYLREKEALVAEVQGAEGKQEFRFRAAAPP